MQALGSNTGSVSPELAWISGHPIEIWDVVVERPTTCKTSTYLGVRLSESSPQYSGSSRSRSISKTGRSATKFLAITRSRSRIQRTLILRCRVHIYNIYKNKLIDNDLGKLVRPLRDGHIESAELLVTDRNNNVLSERIDISDRAYFEGEELPATSTREAWLIGKLNSLTKSTESGYINLTDGERVFYAYVGNNKQALHSIFGTYDGPVRVWAVAYLDESLKPIRLEISEIELAQGELFPTNE